MYLSEVLKTSRSSSIFFLALSFRMTAQEHLKGIPVLTMIIEVMNMHMNSQEVGKKWDGEPVVAFLYHLCSQLRELNACQWYTTLPFDR